MVYLCRPLFQAGGLHLSEAEYLLVEDFRFVGETADNLDVTVNTEFTISYAHCKLNFSRKFDVYIYLAPSRCVLTPGRIE